MHRSLRLARAATFVAPLFGVLALGSATVADASSISACVSKHGGNARIVSAKAKCRRGERKVSWNVTGTAGTPGAPGSPGTPGSNGTNGDGVDYASTSNAITTMAASETGDLILAKAIPAGTYEVNAKAVVAATKGKSATVFVVIVCELVDSTATPVFQEPLGALDISEWGQDLSQNGSEFEAVTTIPLQAQLTTTALSTLAIVCAPVDGSKEATIQSFAPRLSALQTTAND